MAKPTSPATPVLGSLTIDQRKTFLAYAKRVAMNMTDITMFRQYLQYRDRAYAMQLDQSAAKLKEVQRMLKGSERRMTTRVEVPVVMPQIESAVAYQTAVYLLNHPIFDVAAPPDSEDAAQAFSAVLDAHAQRYSWVRELIKAFRNGFKYNFAPAFVHWRSINGKTVGTATEGANIGLGKVEGRTFSGNTIQCLDPYNCFFDMLVSPAEYHEKGSFFGWNELYNRMDLIRLMQSLDPTKTTGFTEALQSGFNTIGVDPQNSMGYYIPQINPLFNPTQARMLRGTNWLEYVGLQEAGANQNRINYRDRYLVTRFLCRALPSDFGARGNIPTIYYGIIINWSVVIYVQEVISINDHLPIFIMQPNEDGLGYQTQSMLDTALPFQDITSSLWNATLESKRRLVFDRLLYNPKLINKEDIDPASAVARIPVRNAVAATDIGKAIYQIPYRDDQSAASLQMAGMLSDMADSAVGQNKVDRGQFQKGNKTQAEFQTVMGNSNSRQQLVSLTIEGQFMTPVKDMLKQNVLLYQPPETLINPADRNGSAVRVDPQKLRDATLEFKLTDGLMSMDKIMSPELLTVFLQTAQSMPVVMTEYDVMGMFIYWMKLKGATWLDDFKRNPQQQQQFLGTLQKTSAATAQQAQQPSPQNLQ
jgi:hypothetical protein